MRLRRVPQAAKETPEQHERVLKRLESVEKLAKSNATRLRTLELEVGIFKPGPVIGESEEA